MTARKSLISQIKDDLETVMSEDCRGRSVESPCYIRDGTYLQVQLDGYELVLTEDGRWFINDTAD